MRTAQPGRSALLACLVLVALTRPMRAADPPGVDLAAGLEALTAKAKALAAEAAESFTARPAPAPVFDTADAADARVRFLVFVADGPLVIEATVAVNGQPFRMQREKMVDQLLAAADTDKDGKPTWQEAGNNPAFVVAGFSLARRSAKRKEEWIRTFDVNHDGVVDRPEARTFIHRHSGQSAFAFDGAIASGFEQPELSQLLDVDGDGVLSAGELAGIPAILKRRDVNDNDVVEAREITPAMETPGFALAIREGETDALYQALRTQARNKRLSVEQFPLVAPLDKNQNGQWDLDESAGLLTMPAHVKLSVHFGKSKDVSAGLAIESIAAPWGDLAGRVHKQGDTTTLVLPGVRLAFRFESRGGELDFDPATILMEQLDGDSNGYLEKSEVQGGGYSSFFRTWDQDGDGKVFAKEMKAYYDGIYAPQVSQLRVQTVGLGAAIHAAIDTSRDGRLSLRELRQASARIQEFDKNRDGKVSLAEIPAAVGITFARGLNYGDQVGPDGAQEEGDAPRWFINMDRNRDGDLTPREFLASAETFKRLDTDGDGLLSKDEAQAAEAKSRPPKVEPQQQVQPSPQQP